jgi:hypothetical protein
MQSKKINELGTNVSPSVNDLTVVGDAATGQLKKITLNQIASLFGSIGGVSSVAMTVPTGLTVTGSPITTSGTLAVTLTAGYSIPTTVKQSEWDTGYNERLKWDGGSSGLNASTARASLGLVIGTDVLAYRTFGSAANNNTADFASAGSLANYLPLVGGTLTGALSGTSATFTSAIINNGTNSTNGIQVISTLTSSLFTGGIEFIRTTVLAGSKIQPLRDATSGGVGFRFLTTADNTAESNGTYNTALTILNNGAATFSSSLTATGGLISNGGAIGYGGGELGFGVTTAGATSGIYTLATGSPILYFDHRGATNTGFWVWRSGTGGGTTALTLSNVGAATFSGSVTTDANLTLNNGTVFVSAGSGLAYTSRLSTAYNFPYVDTYLDSFAGASYEGRINFRTNSEGGALSTKLTIANSGAATFSNSVTTVGNINIQDSSVLNLGYNQGGGATLKYNSNGNLDITPRTGYHTIFTSGNIGIGTISPSANLSLSGSGDIGMRIKASALSYIDFDNADSGTPNGSIAYNNSTNIMTFSTGGSNSEKARITSTGSLLIGSETDLGSGYKLQVNGSISMDYANFFNFKGSSGAGDVIVDNSGSSLRVTGLAKFDSVVTFTTNAIVQGNLLLNTTTDAGAGYKLQVNGSMLMAYANFFNFRGSSVENDVLVDNSGSSLRITGSVNISSSTLIQGLLTNYNSYNTRTSNYTLVLSDASKIVEMNVDSANTVTVPLNSSVAFPIGTEITVMQYGSGNTTIVFASGVTYRSKDFGTRIGDQYTGATLIKRGTNEWYLIGNILP